MKKIAVVTGTRAEYGILHALLLLLQRSTEVELSLIVTGTHLSEAHGYTKAQIVEDGFDISAEVNLDIAGDQPLDIINYLAKATAGIGEALSKISPDLVVLLGDRYEILGAAQAAMLLGQKIAHIHGGEVTLGAMDDSIRHAITKMADLHFTSTPEYKKRVIQLGANPSKVYWVGAPALDSLDSLERLTRSQFFELLGIDLGACLLYTSPSPRDA